MKNNKKQTAVRRTNGQSVKMGSEAHSSRVARTVKIPYEDAKFLTRAAGLGIPGADEYSTVASTVHLDAEGRVKNVWLRNVNGQQRRLQLALEAVDNVLGKKPRKARIPAPKHLDKDLLAVYPLGDPHIGMYAWEAETGDAFDLEIAQELMCTAIDNLVARVPKAETAVLIDLGDFFHADNASNQTSRSGHPLDVDTRWRKVFEVGLTIMTYQIEALLRKHRHVHVIIEPGNHDDHTAVALRAAIMGHYRHEPRVTFDNSPSKFHYFEFGKVLLGVTHGDSVKMRDLPGIMAADVPEAWGRTKFRHWLVGHVHHHKSEEFPGAVVEYFRTLAPRDAWHHNSGYRAGRDQQVWVMHRDYGFDRRVYADISLIKDLIEANSKKNSRNQAKRRTH